MYCQGRVDQHHVYVEPVLRWEIVQFRFRLRICLQFLYSTISDRGRILKTRPIGRPINFMLVAKIYLVFPFLQITVQCYLC
jgi:hypothetical protein